MVLRIRDNYNPDRIVLALLLYSSASYNLTSKITNEEVCMPTAATTKMSSKGQIVIPEDIRKRLKLKAGSQFIVMGENDVVILKTIKPPSMRDFDSMIAKARNQAKKAGLKPADISDAVARARTGK